MTPLDEYGERLVCVRYYCDPATRRRTKTVELVVNDADWHPRARRRDPARHVGLRVHIDEVSLQSRIKAAGGRWDRGCQLWLIRWRDAARPDLPGPHRGGACRPEQRSRLHRRPGSDPLARGQTWGEEETHPAVISHLEQPLYPWINNHGQGREEFVIHR